MKHLRNIVGTCLSAALLAACGGVNNGLSSSTPMSVAPPLAPQSLRSQPAAGGHASQRTKKNVQTESVLHLFTGTRRDGAYPYAALLNVNGTLYGTTEWGGKGGTPSQLGSGTVFKITTSGTETVLHNFRGGRDGFDPLGSLINVGGTLYGTTPVGGPEESDGTVFKITTTGTYTHLYTFKGGADGYDPEGRLLNLNGTLYGTTQFGGTANYGTVFKITTSGTETVLYSFAGGTDGARPNGGLTSVNGRLYGTTFQGGSGCNGSGCGTVFKITTSGTETVIFRFGTLSESPRGGLMNVGDTLYGVSSDVNVGYGAIFKITTSGAYTQLYKFAGGADGEYPNGSLLNLDGTLYGTTEGGGAHNDGTIFALANSGQETVVYSFAGGRDGRNPTDGLINVGGTLYGTTNQPGAGPPRSGKASGDRSGGCPRGDGLHKCGTVFSLSL